MYTVPSTQKSTMTGGAPRPAAHEVLKQNPLLRDGKGIAAIAGAIDATTARTSRLGWRDVELPVHVWWGNITDAIQREDNERLPSLAIAELSPAWVTEQLSSGQVDEVLAVAGLVQSARNILNRVNSAEMSYQTWLD